MPPLLGAGLGGSLPVSFLPTLYGASSAASDRSPSAVAAAARTVCSGSSRLLTHSAVSCSTWLGLGLGLGLRLGLVLGLGLG